MFRRNWLSIGQGWEVVLEVGAGTGGVYLLRWYWWRINAWSEISAMATALAMTLILHHWQIFGGSAPVIFAKTTLATTAVTTAVWVAVTLSDARRARRKFCCVFTGKCGRTRRAGGTSPRSLRNLPRNARPRAEFAGVGAGLRDGLRGAVRHWQNLPGPNGAGVALAGDVRRLRRVAVSRHFAARGARTFRRNRCLTRIATAE